MALSEIRVEDKGKFVVVHLPMNVDHHVRDALEEKSKAWVDSNHILIVLDMSNVLTILNSMYSFFVPLSKILKEKEKKLFSVGVNKKLLLQINSDGMSQVFQPVNSLDEVLQKSGLSVAKRVTLDSNMINPFIEATFNTLKVQANLNSIEAGKPYIKKTGLPDADIGIAAVISMVCSDFKGTISLSFPTQVFLKIYENMLGEQHTVITEEIKDGAGEILNMIYGQAKTTLNAKGYNLEKAIPTVMVGGQLRIHHGTLSAALVVPIHTSFGDFFMEVALGQN